jgi:hypothetical protein
MFPVYGSVHLPWHFWLAATRHPECQRLLKAAMWAVGRHCLLPLLLLGLRLMYRQ